MIKYRFFLDGDSDGDRSVFVVPATRSKKAFGARVMPSGNWGVCLWQLFEMFQLTDPPTEITEKEARRFLPERWRSSLAAHVKPLKALLEAKRK